MPELFDNPLPPADGAVIVRVAVNAALWQGFDYLWPPELGTPMRGQRVSVPFGKGNRPTRAFVTAVAPSDAAAPSRQLKTVAQLLHPQPQLSEPLLRLGEWISQYYLCPLGIALAAMVPAAALRQRPRIEQVAYLCSHHADWPATIGDRQKRVLDELFEAKKQGVEPVPTEQLIAHSGATRQSVQRLAARSLIRLESRPVTLPDLPQDAHADPFELNDDQIAALADIRGRLGGPFSVTLLHGVTGSGKTEVYVRAIREVVAAGRQAILLVPEIALATQTLSRLVERLPRVAVLHSGLTDAQRGFYYDRIRQGQAAVVVGPRSAVFAPTPALGLIVVDEEHEPSYKQDSAPRYHGRDVAIMRASLEGLPVVLGSATPSLESLHNARQGRYRLVRLPRRVRGLPMPKLQIVHLRREMEPGRVELLGATLTRKMAAALDRREQIILLMNRRGYASYVFCPSCHWIMGCPNCSRAMVFHQATQFALCHYCQHSEHLPEHCPACRKKLLLFGYGIQRIEGELARKFPMAKVARMDSDTMTSPVQFQKILGEFARRELDILLGTQMVAKGLDFPGVSLVGVASADTSLAIPDFRAAERTFQLIVQVAGRAGRGGVPGEVVVQTLAPDEPAIKLAVTHDYDAFAATELPARQSTRLPPYSRIVRLVVRHRDSIAAQTAAEKLSAALRKLLPAAVTIVEAQPCGVRRVSNLFRFQILLYCDKPALVQQCLVGRMDGFARDLGAEIVADVDPIQLL